MQDHQLLFLAWCWNGREPHVKFRAFLKPTVNNNTQFWVTQVTTSGTRKLFFFFFVTEEAVHMARAWSHCSPSLDPKGEPNCLLHPVKIAALLQACLLVQHASPKPLHL